MICYVCRAPANGICTSCGAALCDTHFREARTYAVGGARFGCPHGVAARETTARPRATDMFPTRPRRAV
jgi:hypothetical protein